MAATAGQSLRLSPMGKSLKLEMYSRKMRSHLKENLTGMFHGWSSTKCVILCQQKI